MPRVSVQNTSQTTFPAANKSRTETKVSGKKAFYGFLLVIFLSAIPYGTVDVSFKAVLVVAVCCFAAIRIIQGSVDGSFRFSQPVLFFPLIGVLLVAIIQIIPLPFIVGNKVSLAPYETKIFIMTFAALLIAWEVLLYYSDSEQALKALIALVLIVGAASTSFGILRSLVLDPAGLLVHYFGPDTEDYAQFINRNHFAVLIEMALGLTLGLVLRCQLSVKFKLLGWGLCALFLYAAIAANSRGGLISIAALVLFGTLVHILTRRRSTRSRAKDDAKAMNGFWGKAILSTVLGILLLLGFVITIAFVGGDTVVGRFEKLPREFRTEDRNSDNRLAIWRATAQVIEEKPVLGAGFGGFASAITKYDKAEGNWIPQQAHNEYLEVLANGGVVAFTMFAVFAVMMVRRALRNFRSDDNLVSSSCFGALIGMSGVMVHSFVDFGLHVMINALIFTVLLVISMADVSPLARWSLRSSADNAQNRKHGTHKRYFSTAAYLFAVALLAMAGASVGLSHYYAALAIESGSDRDAAEAISYDPKNPEGYESRGLLELRNGNYSKAAYHLQRAVELQSNDFLLWLNLGDALSRSNDVDGARSAYQRAASLAPNYAQPKKSIGLLLLETGADEEAFEFLRDAAQHDNALYPEMLDRALKQYSGNPEAVERAMAPRTLTDRKAVARFLIENHFMTDAVRGLLTGNELNEAEKKEFIRCLIDKHNIQLAYETWLTTMVPPLAKPAADDVVWDGGFESTIDIDTSGFGWQIDQRSSAMAVAIDDRISHSGARSLNVKFTGQIEAGRRLISQLFVVRPHQNYRLTFAVLSAELTSGGLPVVVVETGNPATVARSQTVKPTDNYWVTYAVDFKTNDETTAVLSLELEDCKMGLCPIYGEMSLDDFSVEKIGP